MKTTPVCSIFACLLGLLPMLPAQEPPGGRPGGDPSKGAEMWRVVDRDRDGSISREEFAHMPRLENLPQDKRQALFDRLDKNSDGLISRMELHEGKPGPENHEGMPRIGELDKNGDGMVTFEEFKAGRFSQRLEPEKQERIFKRLDTNGDGKITPADKPMLRPNPEGGDRPRPEGFERPLPEGGERFRPEGVDRPRVEGGGPDKPHPKSLIDYLDKDGDGALSFEEFSASPRMGQLDAETVRQRFRMMDRNQDGKVDRKDIPRGEPQGPGPMPGGPRRPGGESNIE